MTTEAADTADLRKARGAFYTPQAVARYVARWAVRSPRDRVLEPSCGHAEFLLAAAETLRSLGAVGRLDGQVSGVELHAPSAAAASARLAAANVVASVVVQDFLRTEPSAAYDAVIGNPPYVRYQNFAGEARAVAQRAALRAGVALSGLASSWAAFTVHAGMHVGAGGRLGLVLPAEILSVNYAAPVREFLMRNFRGVRLVTFTERIFPGVLEDVVLVLAEGRGEGPTDHCELVSTFNGATLVSLDESHVRRWRPTAETRWSNALLAPETADAYAEAVDSAGMVPLSAWGATTLGIVTGSNGFFALPGPSVRSLGLGEADVLALSPPGSRHLRALSLTAAGIGRLAAEGRATWLFRPSMNLSAAARRYIALGEAESVDKAYKCRIRSPWWRVPYQPPADLLLTYMNADTARLCTNAAQVHHLNSVHGTYLHAEHRQVGREFLALAALNSVSLLGAEVCGRAYGGGVLKLEPREADGWPMPAPSLVRDRQEALAGVRQTVLSELSRGAILAAARAVDSALWPKSDRSRPALEMIRSGRETLHRRRVARSRPG